MRKHILTAFLCGCSFQFAVATEGVSAGTSVVAINILLLPDPDMTWHARDLNRQLRTNDPSGFALDETHVPHISLLHQYVRSQDLPRIFEAVEPIATRAHLVGRELSAKGVEHESSNGRETNTLSVQKTPELAALQQELIAALQPYRQAGGTAAAFYTRGDSPTVDASSIDYVASFVEKRSGDQFKPHITLGSSDLAFAEKLKAQETKPFTFKIADIGIFQLGNSGTARKE